MEHFGKTLPDLAASIAGLQKEHDTQKRRLVDTRETVRRLIDKEVSFSLLTGGVYRIGAVGWLSDGFVLRAACAAAGGFWRRVLWRGCADGGWRGVCGWETGVWALEDGVPAEAGGREGAQAPVAAAAGVCGRGRRLLSIPRRRDQAAGASLPPHLPAQAASRPPADQPGLRCLRRHRQRRRDGCAQWYQALLLPCLQ